MTLHVDNFTSTILQYMDIFFQHFDNNNQNKEMSTGRNSKQNKTSITKDYQQLHLLVVNTIH